MLILSGIVCQIRLVASSGDMSLPANFLSARAGLEQLFVGFVCFH